MKKNHLLAASLLVAFGSSCSEQASKSEATVSEAKLSGIISPLTSGAARIGYYQSPGNEYVLLDSMTPDAEGKFELAFELPKAQELHFGYNRETATLFVEPGDNHQLTLNPEEFDESLKVTGENSNANNYLLGLYLLKENLQNEMGSPFKLPAEEAVAYFDKMEKEIAAFKAEKLAGKEISDEFAQYLSAKEIGDMAGMRINYPSYYTYYTKEEPGISEDYYAFVDKIDWNDAGLLKSAVYRNALSSYINYKTKSLVGEEAAPAEIVQARYEWVQENLKGSVRSYILAEDVLNTLEYQGINLGKGLYEQYTQHHSSSPYFDIVKTKFEEWLPLYAGNPAPNFEYANQEGEKVSLSDFHGKVVYVDVWATWCGPCRREFPYAKELKKKFKGEEDLVFLYVSVDDDVEAWEKFLEKDPEFADAVHIATRTGWESTITKDYLINGIPRYLMIDREGNIANANAPRPSAEETEAKLKELLGSSQM